MARIGGSAWMVTGMLLATAGAPAPVLAQSSAYSFDIPAQDLAGALAQFGRSTGRQLVFDGARTRTVRSPGLRGQFSAEEGLSILLRGTGFLARTGRAGVLIVAPAGPTPASYQQTSLSEDDTDESDPDTAIVVTGTRVKGVPPTSPVITVTEQQIREAGQSDLGEVIRSIPQNFGGGQNPGVLNGGGNIVNQNISSGSALNLRGLGPDATLTLLNGRRLSYNSFTQAVDIEVVPVAAIERIEIVADGASAIYGSDAVGGVANVILKRDFDGVSAGFRVGTSTEGGNTQRQLSLVAGTTWGTGGAILTYDFQRNDALLAEQRDFTGYMPDPLTLLPEIRRHSVVFSGHQELLTNLTLSVDAVYNNREIDQIFTRPTTRQFGQPSAESWIVSPTLTLALPESWTIALNGAFGRDESLYNSRTFNLTTGVQTSRFLGCYCNASSAVELSGEGPLIDLPGGEVRAAIGGGYRRSDLLSYSFLTTSRTDGTRESGYGYGELYVPLVSPAMDVPLIHRLSVTGAVRYENYKDLGDVTTPKLGVIWAPTPDVELKGSWGRSFKAPTLLQEFSAFIIYIWSPSGIGGTGYPAGSQVLMTWGGNRDLMPERARTWTATLSIKPRAWRSFNLDVSYFDIRYTNRIVQPISPYTAALSSPVFAEFLDFTPTTAEINALLALDQDGLDNFSGVPFDPARVVAIAENRYLNVTAENYKGIDISARYTFTAGSHAITPTIQASYVESERRNTSASPVFPLAGTVYNPPNLRIRGGLGWRTGGLTLTGFANHQGDLKDTRAAGNPRLPAQTTFDFTLLYSTGEGRSGWSNLDLSASVANAFNVEPPFLRNVNVQVESYDSTNYSPLGRYINFSIRKRW